jgi:twinkle protein
VGYIALEESVERSCLGIMGVSIDSPLHLDHVFKATSEEELRRAYDATVGTGRVVLYDHFGSMENDRLLNKISQMIKGCNVKTVFLDHLSIVVSALEGGDERRRIDAVCTKLRQLVEENGIRLFLVSHLRRGEGKPLEEGGVTSLNLLRGSAAIAQLADAVIGLERNQQGDNPNVTTVRVLKNRYSGDTGLAGWLEYKKDTGRLVETTLVTPEPEEYDAF